MATTKNGTYYPSNYDEVADVPMDMKKMAESIDKQLDSKVDKVEGKGLSTNDFTNEDKDKLDGLSNYDDSEIKQDIADIQGKNTEQDELIAKLKDNMFNLIAEGTSINVQDASNLPAKLEVSGGVRQDGTPTPDSPVEVEAVGDNVNLFDKDNADKKNIYINYSTKKIITSGNATSIILKCLPNKTYTISRTKILASDFVVGVSNEYPENNTTLTSNVNGNGKLNVSITTSDSDNYLIVYCRWGNIEYTIDEILNTIKIEEGSVATSYSPYGMGSVEINKVNKNWFDKKSNILSQRYFGTSGQIETSTATDAFLQEKYIPVFSNIKLTFSNAIYIRVCEYDKNKNFIKITNSNTQNKITVECTNETKFIRVSFNGSIDDFQIELGEAETDYVSHESEVYNLPIQQPMLSGDTFVKEDGNWFEVHGWEKYVFTGDENWTKSGNSTDELFVATLTGINMVFQTKNKNMICNYFHMKELNQSWEKNKFDLYNQDSSGVYTSFAISFDINKISTIEELKQWLATKNSEENPMYVWYKMNTSTKLPCTPEQAAVLEQLYNMPTYRPVTNIFTQEDLANLKLNYVADSKIYVDNKINAMQANLDTINQLLSTTATSAMLLNNMQADLESEVI